MLGHLTPQERLERIAELLMRAVALDVQQCARTGEGQATETPSVGTAKKGPRHRRPTERTAARFREN
jgi:hypothetical protein